MRSARTLGFVLALFTAPSAFAWQTQILEVFTPAFPDQASSTTAIQGLRPQVSQRGVNLDGSLRAAPTFSMALQGNPFEQAWVGRERLGDVRLDTGVWAASAVDIALPAEGRVDWAVGRSYNARQKNSGGSYIVPNNYQGRSWAQSSQPEIVFQAGSTAADDLIYLVYGADRFVEFRRFDATSDQFVGVNGSAGVFDYQAGTPDLWVYHDQVGTQFTFLGFDTTGNNHNGLLWKIEDEAGNVSFVGHATTVATAISTGWDANGRVTTAYDSSDRRYTYAYTTLNSVVRLTQVKAETKTGGIWTGSPTGVTEVARVDYGYYGTSESYGVVGDLKLATVTTPLSDSGISSTRKTYYRYWIGAYNASTNPGHESSLKYVYDAEGLRAFDWAGDSTFDEDFLTASNASLDPYAAAYFEYDTDRRITKAWFHGECGCSGGGPSGLYQFEYAGITGATSTSAYDPNSLVRTIVERPDASFLTQEFDEQGQAMDRIVSDAHPSSASNLWIEAVVRDSDGIVTWVNSPENVTGYTHATAVKTKASSTGRTSRIKRATSAEVAGFMTDRKYLSGKEDLVSEPTSYFEESFTYTTVSKVIGDAALYRPLVASHREYTINDSTSTTGSNLTSYAYTSHAGTLQVENITTTFPAVTTGNNGSNSATTQAAHYRLDGLPDFEFSTEGRVTYREYVNGQETITIEDADTSSGDVTVAEPTTPTDYTSSGAELHRKMVRAYDPQGRLASTSRSYGVNASYDVQPVYHTRLADQRLVSLGYPDFDGTNYFGPVSMVVRDLAGKTVVDALIGIPGGTSSAAVTTHIDETDADPITAVDTGSSFGEIARMTVHVFGGGGVHEEESRTYFLIPGSGTGSAGTNYDATLFAYDGSGRRTRVKEPSGTIRRSVFDPIGRPIESWIGTNDSSFPSGESSGTDNMVKTDFREYDGGAAGKNGHLTKLTQRVEDSSTNERVTTYTYDYRGRLLLETNAAAPHAFHKVDNLGRRVATGLFSSVASITVTTDDPTTETANRLALSEGSYDELGRVWQTTRHKIDAADGSDDDTLLASRWYDAAGRMIKEDGETLSKTTFDRLGRVTDQFVLAQDDDSSYADALTVSGDTVLEQSQTRYLTTNGAVAFTVRIDRLHDDLGGSRTFGELDTNADSDHLQLTMSTTAGSSNVKGRPSITAYWYDDLNRNTERVEYGTYGLATWTRPGSAPSTSDTTPLWITSYATDGSVFTVTNPLGKVTRTEMDAAGRVVKEIRNYQDGTPSGTDSDVTLRYEYTNGLRTKYIADLPSPATDQETLYIYGTTKGTPSAMKISTGHLLRATVFPDSTNTGTTSANIDSDSSDVVSYAYDAQGAVICTKDQAGNVLEMDFDLRNRQTAQRVTTLAGGFDGAVRRIARSYDPLGRVELVTQYDAASSGSVTDEVKSTYDGWGNLVKYEQDRDSAVGASGSVNDYEISYAFEKAAGAGRNTLRRTSMTMPSGAVTEYKYRTRDGLQDNVASRVTDLLRGATALAVYDYVGVGTVMGQSYPEASVMWEQYSATWNDFPDLDLFGRVVHSRWTKDLATDVDFYHVEYGWDRNGNVTSAKDYVHTGFDVKYAMDGIDRLVDADEGTLSSGTITSRTRRQQWALNQTGNWGNDRVDLNGDGDWVDADEVDDSRTHNDVNELLARNTDSSGGDEFTLAYDASGNLTDDGENYEYEWDAFGRLRKVKRTDNQALVAEYRYNGLGYRIGVHEDTDIDGDVDGSDIWYYDAFDERWRQVARFRSSDTSPKEEFVPHAAGNGGYGTASYIDLVACREKDANTSWTSASDGTLEERVYYCQNWRADVIAILSSGGILIEQARYSAYGIATCLPGGDTESDGDCDSADVAQIQAWITAVAYDVRGDLNLDGTLDTSDKSLALTAPYAGSLGGRSVISAIAHSSRGHSGSDSLLSSILVSSRMRVRHVVLGCWLGRDPIQFADGSSMYQFVGGRAALFVDPFGLTGGTITSTPFGSVAGAGVAGIGLAAPRIPTLPPPPPPTWPGISLGPSFSNPGWSLDDPSDPYTGVRVAPGIRFGGIPAPTDDLDALGFTVDVFQFWWWLTH